MKDNSYANTVLEITTAIRKTFSVDVQKLANGSKDYINGLDDSEKLLNEILDDLILEFTDKERKHTDGRR